MRGRQIRGRPPREGHFPRQPQHLAETEKAGDRSPAQAIADIRDLYGASLPVEATVSILNHSLEERRGTFFWWLIYWAHRGRRLCHPRRFPSAPYAEKGECPLDNLLQRWGRNRFSRRCLCRMQDFFDGLSVAENPLVESFEFLRTEEAQATQALRHLHQPEHSGEGGGRQTGARDLQEPW